MPKLKLVPPSGPSLNLGVLRSPPQAWEPPPEKKERKASKPVAYDMARLHMKDGRSYWVGDYGIPAPEDFRGAAIAGFVTLQRRSGEQVKVPHRCAKKASACPKLHTFSSIYGTATACGSL